jgi:uncharacterized membrane protein YvbJ
MALTNCHECGSRISSKANACPRCGALMTETFEQVLKPRGHGTPERINWPLRIVVAISGILAPILFSISGQIK